MSLRTSVVIVVALASAATVTAHDKKKDTFERAMVEKMEAVPCGAKERGIAGVGAVWASAGITHVNSDEKLCPQYLLRTDEMDYEIRPVDTKHPVALPVGHEGQFRIKNDRMILKSDDGDGKTREYKIVAESPADTSNTGPSASK